MKKLFFLLLSMMAAAWFASLYGCKKCHAEGRILEFGTDNPIPNATVSLTECEGDVLGNLNCFATATATTDANGEVSFDKTGFALAAEAPGYWPTGDDFVQFTSECPDPVTVRLFPEAWLEVTIRNESGAYAFSDGSELYLLTKGEQFKFIRMEKGNTSFRFLFSILLSENISAPNPAPVKFIVNDIEQVPEFNSFANWVDLTPKGHQTTKITLIY